MGGGAHGEDAVGFTGYPCRGDAVGCPCVFALDFREGFRIFVCRYE